VGEINRLGQRGAKRGAKKLRPPTFNPGMAGRKKVAPPTFNPGMAGRKKVAPRRGRTGRNSAFRAWHREGKTGAGGGQSAAGVSGGQVTRAASCPALMVE